MAVVTWVFAVMPGVSPAEPRGHLHCERCDERSVPAMPMDLSIYIDKLRSFTNLHESCVARVPAC